MTRRGTGALPPTGSLREPVARRSSRTADLDASEHPLSMLSRNTLRPPSGGDAPIVMTPEQAIRFIRYHGVVLESAKGSDLSLAERIAGGPIHGSWWSHPLGSRIYQITQYVRTSKVILVCGLAKGRVTFVHRRLWPSFIRLAGRFPPHALDQIREIHLPSGRHKREDVPFPKWVPGSVMKESLRVSESDAAKELQPWIDRYSVACSRQ